MLYILAIALFTASCEKTIQIDVPASAEKIVVEGFIETGQPPYVLLTRNAPFFGSVDFNAIDEQFVNGASVTVTRKSDGGQIQLTEICLDAIEALVGPEQARQLLVEFGLPFSDSVQLPNICIYAPLEFFTSGDTSFVGEINETYELEVVADDVTLNASTTIKEVNPIVGLEIRPHKDERRDTLKSVYVTFSVPDTFGNFIRYFTKRNDEPFYAPIFGSVFDDKLFIGQELSLPLERGQEAGQGIDPDIHGYFWVGDTVTLRWCSMDKAHYDFWNTLENDGGDTPFSSPTRVSTNVENGRGIWGGYDCVFETIIVTD